VGKVEIACLIRKSPNTFTRAGRIRAKCVSVSFKLLRMRKDGINVTWNGIIRLESIIIKSNFLPLKLIFAKINPPYVAIITELKVFSSEI